MMIDGTRIKSQLWTEYIHKVKILTLDISLDALMR